MLDPICNMQYDSHWLPYKSAISEAPAAETQRLYGKCIKSTDHKCGVQYCKKKIYTSGQSSPQKTLNFVNRLNFK